MWKKTLEWLRSPAFFSQIVIAGIVVALWSSGALGAPTVPSTTSTAKNFHRYSMTAEPTNPLPGGLTLTDNGCTFSDVFRICEWVLEGRMDQPAGNYHISVKVTDRNSGTGSADASISVTHRVAYMPLMTKN
jgi:hypothetical protein